MPETDIFDDIAVKWAWGGLWYDLSVICCPNGARAMKVIFFRGTPLDVDKLMFALHCLSCPLYETRQSEEFPPCLSQTEIQANQASLLCLDSPAANGAAHCQSKAIECNNPSRLK